MTEEDQDGVKIAREIWSIAKSIPEDTLLLWISNSANVFGSTGMSFNRVENANGSVSYRSHLLRTEYNETDQQLHYIPVNGESYRNPLTIQIQNNGKAVAYGKPPMR